MTIIQVANIISKDLKKNHSELLEEHNLTWVFQPLEDLHPFRMDYNGLVCAIIFSYHPESTRVDLKHDGYKINETIIRGLGLDTQKAIYKAFIEMTEGKIIEAKGNFFDLLSNQWEFVSARSLIDSSTKIMRMSDDFPNLKEEEKKLKAQNELSKLKQNSIIQRKTADELIDKLKREFMITDEMTKKHFGVSFVEENIKRDIFSWREFIHEEEKKKAAF